MKRLIDLFARFATAGDASGGSCDGIPAQPAKKPFQIHDQPAVRCVAGEKPDADFIEVIVLGDEGGVTSMYQCEATTPGEFKSEWWKVAAADLKDAAVVEFIALPASSAHTGGSYPRAVKTGSRTFQDTATAGTAPSKEHVFQLNGRGSSICYKQLS
jgi:hypothetical protein